MNVHCENVYGNIGPMNTAPVSRSGASRPSSSRYCAPRETPAATARSVAVASSTARQSRATASAS